MSDDGLIARIRSVRERIARACERAGRSPDEVTLVAVTKTHPAEAVRAAHAAGLLDLGESYAQEWRAKAADTSDLAPPVRWHYVGHLQSNKARLLVGHVHMIHSIDRPSVARAVAERSARDGVTTQVLIEVNVAGEAQKSGCAPADLPGLARLVLGSPGLELRGLMTVAPDVDDAEDARPFLRELRRLRDGLRAEAPPTARITELSMGMSGDLEVAVEEGATLVRVGTALFGARPV